MSSGPTQRWAKNFQTACCLKFGLAPYQYRTKLFWHCLYRHALPVAGLFYWIHPKFFADDFWVIEQVGNAANSTDFQKILDGYYFRSNRYGGFFRDTLAIRISGKRLIHLKDQVFPPEAAAQAAIESMGSQ